MDIFKGSGLAQRLAKSGVSVTDRPVLNEAALNIAKFWIEERPLEAVRVHHGQVAGAPDRLLLGGEQQARSIPLATQLFMDPEILDFEHTAPGESRQPCSDHSTFVACKDGKREIISVAGGGYVVGDQLLFDEAHIGFSRSIVNDHVMRHHAIGLAVVTHLSSLLDLYRALM